MINPSMRLKTAFGDVKCFKVGPHASYTTVKRLGKSKVGKRWVRVRRFVGHSFTVAKGLPVMDKQNKALYLHPHDYEALRQEMERKVNHSMGLPTSLLGFGV
ncbi:TPA: hypothetical protein ACRZ4F_001580 [Vibrio harveyi]